VEFRSESSLLVSCLNRNAVVTLDLPSFGGGAGGTGGNGGGGEGGSGSCMDDIGPRPTLTAQPTVSATTVSPGDQISLSVPVSAEARYVRVRIFDGFSALAAEAETTTNGSETLDFDVTISESATIGFDLFVGILLCDDPACLTNQNPDQVSYTRPGSTSGAGDPYFASVREDGVSRPDISTLSCFDLLVLDVVAP
jgi:hypothetical protein